MRGEIETASTPRLAIQWNDGYNPQEFSFANNINTHEGGTHLSGFRSALDAHGERLRQCQQPGEGPQGRHHQRRRHPRGHDVRHQASRFRTRSLKARRRPSSATPRSRASSRPSSTTSWARSSKRTPPSPSASSRRRWNAAGRATRRARRAILVAPQGRGWTQHRCPASWPTARSAIRRKPRSTSWKASRPAARPAGADEPARSRPSCHQGQDPQRGSARGSTACSAPTKSRR